MTCKHCEGTKVYKGTRHDQEPKTPGTVEGVLRSCVCEPNQTEDQLVENYRRSKEAQGLKTGRLDREQFDRYDVHEPLLPSVQKKFVGFGHVFDRVTDNVNSSPST